MKFMIHYAIPAENRHDALKTFAQMSDADDEADRGGVTLVGRWHDIAGGMGVAICDSQDLGAVQSWALNWNHVVDLEITPVVDDAEAKAIAKAKLL